jgi:Skp family chaperone for outer membrane proteins
MTRNSLVVAVAVVALALAAGALVFQFVVPSKGDGVSRADFDALRSQVAAVKSGGAGLKVAFVNIDNAFAVFLNAVSDLRQRSADKLQQITDLQGSLESGTVTQDQYQKRLNEYNTELLDANIAMYASVLDRMIASSSFSDLRADLQRVREMAQSLLDEAKNLVSMVKGGAISSSEFQARLARTQTNYTSLEKIVTQACAVKISQAAQKVAIPRGFDLVLIQKNVVLYFSPAMVTDITEFVKSEIAGYL